MNNEECRQKQLLMQQVYMCQFQIEFKFGVEDKLWQKRYRRRFVELEVQEF